MLVRDVNSALREHPQYSRLIPYVQDMFHFSSLLNSSKRADLTKDLAKLYKDTAKPCYESEEALLSSDWDDQILVDLMVVTVPKRTKVRSKLVLIPVNLFWRCYFKRPISLDILYRAGTIHSLIMALNKRG